MCGAIVQGGNLTDRGYTDRNVGDRSAETVLRLVFGQFVILLARGGRNI